MNDHEEMTARLAKWRACQFRQIRFAEDTDDPCLRKMYDWAAATCSKHIAYIARWLREHEEAET